MTRNRPAGADDPDRDHRALSNEVRPADWVNPTPGGRYDLAVIGAGPGGLIAAREAAALGAKVALIERDRLGGGRLNVGCIPSKAIIRSARLDAEMRDAESVGAKSPRDIEIDFPAVMARMRRIQARLGEADSAARLTEAGVDLFFGPALFTGADTLAIDGEPLAFKKALIATGSRSLTPRITGLAEAGYLTNESVFGLERLPRRLLVIGGGPVGCELAQAFSRFGAKVIIAQDDPTFLPQEERDAAQILSDSLARDGVEIHLNTTVIAVRLEDGHKVADLVSDDVAFSIQVDEILAGIGRSPNVEGLNLEAAGVRYNTDLGVEVDDFLRTSNPRIHAAGDVCMAHRFTHVAEATALMALKNALFLGRERLSALTIPWCTYTDPEIAHVGLYVREARRDDIPVRTFTALMHDVDRAATDGEEEGFVKIHVRDGGDQILGATIVARHAGEMINGLSVAITAGIGVRTLGRVIYAYPTQVEAIKMAAEAYNRTLRTPRLKAMAKRWLDR